MADSGALSEQKFPSAPLWRRLAAMVYDSFLLVALSMAYGGVVLAGYIAIYGPVNRDYTPVVGGILFQLGWVATLVAFYCFFWRRGGQTSGMRAWRLKLVSRDGQPPSMSMCLLRVFTAIPSFALLGLGYFWCLADPNGDCLHDKLSATRVLLLPKNT